MRTQQSFIGKNAPWHLLQVSDVLDVELASALSETVPVMAWKPRRSLLPFHSEPVIAAGPEVDAGDRLQMREFYLTRGFARFPMSLVAKPGRALAEAIAKETPDPSASPLICTVPFFADVAEHWPGPVIYWLTDLMTEYKSLKTLDLRALDRKICSIASLVCPNSERISDYLIREASCDPSKLHIVPNAARAANVRPSAPQTASPLPLGLDQCARPVAGVIGNMAGNIDWVFLKQVVEATAAITWVFVGPVSMEIDDSVQRRARLAVMKLQNTHFLGSRPYGELAEYARAFDVAVLPYRRCEPTYSGSSTRFYEHLLACRPMLATSGLAELKTKEPLLRLTDTPGEMVTAIRELQATNFDDGLASLRWSESHKATWSARAASMREGLEHRLRATGTGG